MASPPASSDCPSKTLVPLPGRSELDSLLEPDAFVWATGIEDTFVFNPDVRTGRILDEYELTNHYVSWEQDLCLVAGLGVRAARYGIPWYRVNPEEGRWDWDFADRTLGRLLDLGVDPIVDLIHYSTPAWLEGSFLDPKFPAAAAEYARRLAERFQGRIRWYTPMNEPRITAHYCGRIGWWPPYRRGWRGFVSVLLACCRSIVLISNALDEVDPEIVRLHVDATDLYVTDDPSLTAARDLRQSLVFLALDLISGRVGSEHELYNWMLMHGASPADLEWFQKNAVSLDAIGINMYPMFTLRTVVRRGQRVRFEPKYATGRMVKDLGMMYWERFGNPLMITETASMGSIRRRAQWMDDSIAAVKALRENAAPIFGYTWWPLFDLVSWGYRQSELPIGQYIVEMGLYDLEGDDLRRVRTPLVDQYIAAVRDEAGRVGRLAPDRGLIGVL